MIWMICRFDINILEVCSSEAARDNFMLLPRCGLLNGVDLLLLVVTADVVDLRGG